MFNLLTILLSTIIVLLTWLFVKFHTKYQYWNRRKVPHSKPTFLLGNYGDHILQKKYLGEVAQELCQKFPNEPYIGAYMGTEPVLIVQDLELIKLITTKDFYYFHSREIMEHTRREHIGKTMFFDCGDNWKTVRQNMTPFFSTSKMKNMFYLIEKCAKSLETILDELTSKSDVVEIKSLMAKYTISCICSCAFGIEPHTLTSNTEDNRFVGLGDAIFDCSGKRAFSVIARTTWPAVFYGLGFQVYPKEISEFFHKFLVSVFESRDNKPTSRNDFVDMLLSLKQKKYITGESIKKNGQKIQIEVDDQLLSAQGIQFFGAGFETSATTLSFILYELAKDQVAQRRVFEEIDSYLLKHKGKINYECVNEMPYLQACVKETMRLYPVLNLITREVVEDYTLPTGLCLEKGLRIHLPVYHLHYHADYFPDPEKFLPERFLPKNEKNIEPYSYIPFGEGPRMCIGE